MRQPYQSISSRLTFDQMVVSLLSSDPCNEKSPLDAAYPYAQFTMYITTTVNNWTVVSLGLCNIIFSRDNNKLLSFPIRSEFLQESSFHFLFPSFMMYHSNSTHDSWFKKKMKFFCTLTQTHRRYYDLFIACALRICYILILCNCLWYGNV